MMKILGICGSLQAQSKNLALLHTAARLVPPGVELALFDGLRDLPHFNPDIEAEAPDSVRRWRQVLSASDAVNPAALPPGRWKTGRDSRST